MATDDPATIDQQIDKTLGDSAAATDRIKKDALETEELAKQTAAELNEQGKQIDGIHNKVVGIEEDARAARREASKLEWCGCWYRCCHGEKAYTKKSGGDSDDGAVTSEPRSHSKGQSTNKQDQIEGNIHDIRETLDNIEGAADYIGTELDRQNDKIEDITKHADKAGKDLRETTDIAKSHT